MRRVPLFVSLLAPLVFGACGAGQNSGQPVQLAQAVTIGMNDVLQYAKDAGLACDSLVMAGAIAGAESSLDTYAFGTNPPTAECPLGSRDRGLWQIDDCYNPEVSDACAFDPACNASAMVTLSEGGLNWAPWAAYNDGSFSRWIPLAQAAYDDFQEMLGCP